MSDTAGLPRRMPSCLHDVHQEVVELFAAAGCRTQEERQALAEELVGAGPYSLTQGRELIGRLREAIAEPYEGMPS